MLYYARGSENENLKPEDLQAGLCAALDKLGTKQKVLTIPPDITRLYSRAGLLTQFAWQYYGDTMTNILPALGTHFAMTDAEI
nr:D-mannonate epimerase [Planctomycetota bacterium]